MKMSERKISIGVLLFVVVLMALAVIVPVNLICETGCSTLKTIEKNSVQSSDSVWDGLSVSFSIGTDISIRL